MTRDTTDREDLRRRLGDSSEVNITVKGRKTMKRITTPVWFVVDGPNVILVPMKGSENEWFKNLEKNPQIELSVDESAIPFTAKIVRDSDRVEMVLDRFRSKYKSMWSESYYTKRDVYVELTIANSP